MKKTIQFFCTLSMLIVITNTAQSAELKTFAESQIKQGTPTSGSVLTRQQRVAAIQLSETDRKELERIKEYVNKNKKDYPTITVLNQTMSLGDLKILEWLLGTGQGKALCNIHERGACDSDFFYALQRDNQPIINLFLKYGADINFVDENGDTYTHKAVLQNTTDMLKQLIRLKADINKKNGASMTPLCLAAAVEKKDAAQLLIKAGGTCDDSEYQDFLTHLGYKTTKEIIPTFGAAIEKEPTEDEITRFAQEALNKGISELMLAIKTNNVPMVRYFAQHESESVNEPDQKTGETPLIYAIKNYHNKVVKALIDSGTINVNEANRNSLTPLIFSTHIRNLPAMSLLLNNRQIQVNEVDNNGNTAAHWAALFGFMPELKLLQQYNADLSVYNKEGLTPIHYLIVHGIKWSNHKDDTIIQFLKDHLSLVNTQSTHRAPGHEETPLFIAIYNPDALESLIAAGIDLTRTNNDRTILAEAIGNAIESGQTEAIQILLRQPTIKQMLHAQDQGLLTYVLQMMNLNPNNERLMEIATMLRLAGATSDNPLVRSKLDRIDQEIQQSKLEVKAAQAMFADRDLKRPLLPELTEGLVAGYLGAPEPTEEERKTATAQRKQAQQAAAAKQNEKK